LLIDVISYVGEGLSLLKKGIFLSMLLFFTTTLISCKRENNLAVYNYCIEALQNNGYELPPEDKDLKIFDSKTNQYLLFYYIPQEKITKPYI